jgi:hypothetical protein
MAMHTKPMMARTKPCPVRITSLTPFFNVLLKVSATPILAFSLASAFAFRAAISFGGRNDAFGCLIRRIVNVAIVVGIVQYMV